MTTNKNKIILVTGANKGIGFETSRALATAGHTVLMGARDPGRGRAAAAALQKDHLDVSYLPLDVTDESSITAAAEQIAQDHGRLDVLINNAAITRRGPHPTSEPTGTLSRPEDVPITSLRAVVETNAIGPAAMIKHTLPLLRKSDAALIGNVSSGLGTVDFLADPDAQYAPYALLIAYNSSKAMLNAITLIYARALQPEGIRVVALSPGFVATDLNNNTGADPVDVGGRRIAEQVLRESTATGVFLKEDSLDAYPW